MAISAPLVERASVGPPYGFPDGQRAGGVRPGGHRVPDGSHPTGGAGGFETPTRCGRRSIRWPVAASSSRRNAYSVRVDVVDPHDEGVLPGHRVVVLAHGDRGEPEAPVQGLGRLVVRRHLERDVLDPAGAQRADAVDDHRDGHAPALEAGRRGDGGHVRLVVDHHEADIARHLVAVPYGAVEPALAQRELGVEHRDRPRLGEDLALNAQQLAQVPPLELLDAQHHVAILLRPVTARAKLLVASASRI